VYLGSVCSVLRVVGVLGSAFRSTSSSVCHDKSHWQLQLGRILHTYIHTYKIDIGTLVSCAVNIV
jgi:hypothetical protein